MKNDKLIFDPDTHEYIYDGQKIPSVTHILRFVTVDEAANAQSWLRDEAAERGTAIHAATVMYDYDGVFPDDFPAEWQGYLKAYQRFTRDFAPEWEITEMPMAATDPDGLAFAGTPDRFGKLRGELAVVDIKTGSKINHLYCGAQLYAYYCLIHRYTHRHINAGYVLHLCKDGTYELHRYGFGADRDKRIAYAWYTCLDLNTNLKSVKGEKI